MPKRWIGGTMYIVDVDVEAHIEKLEDELARLIDDMTCEVCGREVSTQRPQVCLLCLSAAREDCARVALDTETLLCAAVCAADISMEARQKVFEKFVYVKENSTEILGYLRKENTA